MLPNNLLGLFAKSSKYTNLFINPDFQDWKSEILDKRLNVLADKILNSEPGSKEQIEHTFRYQELKYISDDFFRLMKNTEDRLRKKDKEEVS